jgi:hypothetical protein
MFRRRSSRLVSLRRARRRGRLAEDVMFDCSEGQRNGTIVRDGVGEASHRRLRIERSTWVGGARRSVAAKNGRESWHVCRDGKQHAHRFRMGSPGEPRARSDRQRCGMRNGLFSGARPRGRASLQLVTTWRHDAAVTPVSAAGEGNALEGVASARRARHRSLRGHGGAQNPVNLMVDVGCNKPMDFEGE